VELVCYDRLVHLLRICVQYQPQSRGQEEYHPIQIWDPNHCMEGKSPPPATLDAGIQGVDVTCWPWDPFGVAGLVQILHWFVGGCLIRPESEGRSFYDVMGVLIFGFWFVKPPHR